MGEAGRWRGDVGGFWTWESAAGSADTANGTQLGRGCLIERRNRGILKLRWKLARKKLKWVCDEIGTRDERDEKLAWGCRRGGQQTVGFLSFHFPANRRHGRSKKASGSLRRVSAAADRYGAVEITLNLSGWCQSLISPVPADLESLVDARQKLESQQQENQGVQSEFAQLDDESNIYKLVGPVLLKQDKTEAVMAVKGRLEFIEKEMFV